MNRQLQKILSSVIAFVMLFTSVITSNVVAFADTETDGNTSVSTSVSDDRGDVNGDDVVDVNDASAAMQYVLNKANYKGDYSADMLKYMADVDSDGYITASDVAQILQKALDGNFVYSGKKGDKPSTDETTTEATTKESGETTTEKETDVETTTETAVETTTEETTETTTEKETVVDGEPQDAIYEGYDIVVDARVETNATREGQPIFKTVNEALATVKSGGTEDKPIVIGIVPGLYRENVRVNAPWITFKKITNSTSKEKDATLTWYWLTSYTYDNIGDDGTVDMSMPNKDGHNDDKMPNWGRSTWIQKGATGFRAEGIYFENSANLYVTQEELDANVRVSSNAGNNKNYPNRNELPAGYGTEEKGTISYGDGTSQTIIKDVRAKAWRERGCALYTEADKAVFKDCKVISTQDTIGTAGRAVFDNCYLAGTVDFICGGGEILFNNCNIHWQSSPYTGDGDGGGALTAAKTDAAPANGYLFYNCTVSGNDTTEGVNLGRPWSGTNAETVWINTTSEISKVTKKPLIDTKGWGGMGCDPEDARSYFEYNSKDVNGNVLDTSARRGTTNDRFKGGVLDEYTAIKYNPYRYTAYKNSLESSYDGWDPLGIADEWKAIEEKAVVSLEESYKEDFVLPDAPDGYEVKYYVNSNFASIGDDGKTVTVTRPLYGQPGADVTFTAYVKKAGTIQGKESQLATKIPARDDASGTFNTAGKVKLSFAQESNLNVRLSFDTAGGFHAKDVAVTIPAGEKEVSYTAENLPAAEYNVTVTFDSTLVSVKGGKVKKIVGEAGVDKNLDIELGVLETITVKAGDAVGTPSSGYTFAKYADETKGEVYHYVRPQGGTTNQKFYWDLGALISDTNKADFTSADQVRINFSVKYPSCAGKDTNYISILGGDQKDFALSKDTTRYLLQRFGGNWKQSDILRYDVGNWKGSSNNDTQKLNIFEGVGNFNGANTGWNDVVVTLDYKNGQVIVDSPQANKSKAPFILQGIPTDITRDKLMFMFYGTCNDTKSATEEMYISKPIVSYERFVPEIDDSNGVSITGTSNGITEIVLVNTEVPAYKFKATIDEDGKVTFDKVPAGKYEITYKTDGSVFDTISGTGITTEDGKYYLSVGETEISDFSITTKVLKDFTAAESAVNKVFADYTSHDAFPEEGDTVATLTQSVPAVASVEGYEITLIENDYIKADGSLKIVDESLAETAINLLYQIKNLGTDQEEDYVVGRVKPLVKPSALAYYEPFEGYVAGASIASNGDTVTKGENGNTLVVDKPNGKVQIATFNDAVDENGVYAISLDVSKTANEAGNNGYRINFGSAFGTVWTGNTFAFNGEDVKGTDYTDDSKYGTTSPIITGPEANKPYHLTFVVEPLQNNVRAYVDGEYVTSHKLADNGTFENIRVAGHNNPESKIIFDNISVEKLISTADSKAKFDEAMTDVTIPTEEIAKDSSITVPVKLSDNSVDNSVISWTTDNTDAVVIDSESGKIDFKAQKISTTAKLTATVENPSYKTYSGANVSNVIGYTKDYSVAFATTSSDFFTLNGTVTFDFAPEADVTVKVDVMNGEDTINTTNVTVGAGKTSKAYTINEVPAGSYTVKYTVLNNDDAKYKVRLADENITGVSGGNATSNVTVGELVDKVKTVDLDSFQKSADNLTTLTAAKVLDDTLGEALKLSGTGTTSEYVYYDLGSIVGENGLADLDNVKVSFKNTYKSHDEMNNTQYALVSTLPKKFTRVDSGDSTSRFIGFTAYQGWNVLRVFGSLNSDKVNGISNDLKFANEGAGNADVFGFDNWQQYDIDIDLANGSVTATGSGNSKVKGDISVSKKFKSYPTDLGNNGLYLVMTAYSSASTAYFKDITITYKAFKTAEDNQTYQVTGTVDSGVANIQLQSTGTDAVNTYTATIDSNNFTIADVPAGEYKVIFGTNAGFDIETATGLTATSVAGEYTLTVVDDVSEIAITTTESNTVGDGDSKTDNGSGDVVLSSADEEDNADVDSVENVELNEVSEDTIDNDATEGVVEENVDNGGETE